MTIHQVQAIATERGSEDSDVNSFIIHFGIDITFLQAILNYVGSTKVSMAQNPNCDVDF